MDTIRVNFDKLYPFPPHQMQLSTITRYMRGCDSILCAPTGYGKSVIYQIAPSILPSCSNKAQVISPLLSLISDSVDKTNALSTEFKAVSLSDKNVTSVEDFLSATHIFTTPESIFESHWKDSLLLKKSVGDGGGDAAVPDTFSMIGVIVVDECHVISS